MSMTSDERREVLREVQAMMFRLSYRGLYNWIEAECTKEPETAQVDREAV